MGWFLLCAFVVWYFLNRVDERAGEPGDVIESGPRDTGCGCSG